VTALRDPIAIVGIGCRFPGGVDSPSTFWQVLLEKVDAIGEIPRDRFDLDVFYDPRPATPGKVNSRFGGFLPDIETFDADFFGIAPREAERLDPQQRLLLEVGWEALEDAGLRPESLVGSATGVFVGMWLNDYEGRLFSDPAGADFYMTTGSGRYAASGRLSYAFGLQGPSITIDTACSSSLAAIHLACQSLWMGDSDLALAGGANVILQPDISVAYSQSQMLAPDGRCKFGDSRANGYVRSEGAALVALKTLSAARRDGDRVYAVILGGTVNNDGRSSGFMTTPGQGGQEDMLRKAYRNAGVSPGLVQYVEAHGTGTRAGDPVELGALGAVLAEGRSRDRPCAVGSVKTNLGHTEGAAGVAGLIKVALSLTHRTIPASLHMIEPSPAIAWDSLPLYVPKERQPWPEGEGRSLAGVSAFGISGTNAHIVLAEADVPAAIPPSAEPRPHLLTLSAHSPAALVAQARRFQEWLRRVPGNESVRDIAYTAARRRGHLQHRLAVVGRDREGWAESLEVYARGETGEGISAGVAREGAHRVVFVFPGQGGQWLGMGRQLLEKEPVFRAAIERWEEAFRPYVGWSLTGELTAEAGASHQDDISVVQPTLFAVEVALAELWRSWGVEPDAVVGHSMGEAAAAYVAGALSADAAARVICRRSELLRRISGRGAMAVVELSMDEARGALAGFEDRVSVAVSNSARSSVISGDPESIDRILAALEAREVFCRRVKVDVASHSPQVEPLLGELIAGLGDLPARSASVPIFSTVLGGKVDGATLGAAYWARNLREPVRFATAVRALVAEGCDTFIEMGPHPVLVGAIQQELADREPPVVALPSLRRERDEQTVLLESVGALHASGVSRQWERLFPTGRVVSLPTYAWQRERHWHEGPSRSIAPSGPAPLPGESATRGSASPDDGAVYEVVWSEAPLAARTRAAEGASFLLIDEGQGLGKALAARLVAMGAAATTTDPPPAGQAFDAVWSDLARWTAVVHLSSVDAPDFAAHSERSLEGASERDTMGLIGLARALAGLEGARTPRLYVVTAGTQAVTAAADVTSPAAALLWGLTRVVDAEQPRLRCTNVDIPAAWDAGVVQALTEELLAAGADNQVGLRSDRRFVPRLRPRDDGRAADEAQRSHWRSPRPAGGETFSAIVRHPGTFDALTLVPRSRTAPAPGQVQIEVVTCGLNFMNALSLLGEYPGYPRGVGPLGGDCAGRVTAVGEGVTSLRVGDRVMAAALDSLATHVVVDARLVMGLPGDLDFEQGATIPIAFLTATYALETLARLGPGETVLIHAATGGVGLAALQVARGRGAEVIGSAGSAEKRALLQTLGVAIVVDSRSTSFAEAVREATGGRGVDVVLNCLAGEFVERGLSVLAPGGRFVELGKRDIHAGRPLDLRAFRNGISFLAVDLDHLIRNRPEQVGALLTEIKARFESGAFRPLPHQTFPISRASEALRTLGEARHVGKLVVRIDDPAALLEAPGLDHDRLRAGTCLVTGGLGALGLRAAQWLFEAGARHLVLVSRRPPGEAAQLVVQQLESGGATVRVVEADVSDRSSLEQVLDMIASELPPLYGAVHTAGVIEGATLSTMRPDQYRRVFAGKAAGAVHLHSLTAGLPLGFFVLYSSVAPLIGAAGESHYAGASAFLDALAAFRRGRGLPGTSINWGPWADVGMMAADDRRGARMRDLGFTLLAEATGRAVFLRALDEVPVQAVAVQVDWQRYAEMLPEVAGWPFFADVVARPDAAAPVAASVRDTVLAARPGRERAAALEEEIRQLVGRVLRQNAARIDAAKTFRALGLDSLMGLELRTQLERRFAIAVPATLVWNYPTVSALAREMARRAEIPMDAEPTAAPEPEPGGADLEAMLAQLEGISDEEARRLLETDPEGRG
jgi:acyl transferase domain-containing protein/acyl carrier protein